MQKNKRPIEAPREKFQRIATLRTNKVIKGLQSLAKLSNPRSYSYSKTELNKIFSAINNEVRVARAMFDKHQREKFEL